MLHDVVHYVLPKSIRDRMLVDIKNVTIPYVMPEPEDITLTVSQAVSGLFGIACTSWYALTKHFLANNGLGLAYCLEVSFSDSVSKVNDMFFGYIDVFIK